MTLLCLIRHGHSTGNRDKLFSGYTEEHHELTSKGHSQVEQAAKKLSGITFSKLWSSKLKRAIQTAQIIRMHSLKPPEFWVTTEALNERKYGQMSNLSRAEAVQKYGQPIVDSWSYTINQKPPGGESIQEVAQRAQRYYKNHIEPNLAEDDILIVSHYQIVRGLVSYIEEIPLRDTLHNPINNAEPIIYEF